MLRIGSVSRVLGYIALSAITLEIAARVDDYWKSDAPLLHPYTINQLFRPSTFGREGVPWASFGKWHMNELGYRGPSPTSGRRNVLTFGASETFGLYESANHEYPRLLEARLNARQPRGFNVINIALPGMRIGRVDYLEHAIERTQAGHVIIYPSPANYIGISEPLCGRASMPVPSQWGLSESIRLVAKLDQLVKKVVPLTLMTPLWHLAIWRATRHQLPMAHVPEATIAALREDLVCAVHVAKRHGATPLLATHATYFGDRINKEDETMLLAWRRFYPELREEGFIDLERRTNDAIRSVAMQHGVHLVDAAAAIPRGADYFADFVHFTNQGASKMADAIASVMAASEAPESIPWPRAPTGR